MNLNETAFVIVKEMFFVMEHEYVHVTQNYAGLPAHLEFSK
ncbi:hypothetical protein OAT16_05190 [Prolixibacteraceae bacterium]|nr:hypothetical protein [Prolixibacteraceae bacterium]